VVVVVVAACREIQSRAMVVVVVMLVLAVVVCWRVFWTALVECASRTLVRVRARPQIVLLVLELHTNTCGHLIAPCAARSCCHCFAVLFVMSVGMHV